MSKKFWEYFIKGKDKETKEEDSRESGSGSTSDSGSSSGGTGTGRIKPHGDEGFPTTYLVEETEFMQYERRGLEQQVERQLASVEERRKPQRKEDNGPGLQEKMKQHPLLDSQRFDGIDPSLNPAPFGNQEAMIEFENERREQEMDKQLRLGNMPKMGRSMTPEPRMG
jgi:hypothetical protein